MMTTTYTKARANLAKLCDTAANHQEVIIIERRGAQNVAIVSADELSSLVETAHLLRSPKNAKRLLNALNRAQKKSLKTSSLTKLKKELSLE